MARMLGIPSGEGRHLGAAGGFAAPFVALASARVRSGAELVRERSELDAVLARAGLCITGEGKVDNQSPLGKTVAAVLRAAARHGIPAVVVGGHVDDGCRDLYGLGAAGVFGILRRPVGLDEALSRAAEDLRWAGRAITSLMLASG